MDKAKQYMEQARAAGIHDEDIIFELTKQGWSIPQVHKLIYGGGKPQEQMFVSSYSPPRQPVVLNQPTTGSLSPQVLNKPQPQLTTPVQPQIQMNQNMQQKQPKKSRILLKIILVVLGTILLSAIIFISILYFL